VNAEILAHFSALWIIMANSWMQTPAGYQLMQTAGGDIAVMTSFKEVVFTPSFIPRLMHVWVASWIVGASLMLSVSAWYLLKNRHVDLAQACFKVALPVFTVLGILQVFAFGASQAIEVTNYQAVKLAAMEGLWQSGPARRCSSSAGSMSTLRRPRASASPAC
jgi:cytochrome d ubiquinol oxidase subunit I